MIYFNFCIIFMIPGRKKFSVYGTFGVIKKYIKNREFETYEEILEEIKFS